MQKFRLNFSVTDVTIPLENENLNNLQERQLQDELQRQHSIRKHQYVSIELVNDRLAKLPILEHFFLLQTKQLCLLIEIEDLKKNYETSLVLTLLLRMPHLQELFISLENANFNENILFTTPLKFNKLNKFEIDEKDSIGNILKFIEAPKLTTFVYIENSEQKLLKTEIDSLANFLTRHKNLDKIDISANNFQQLITQHHQCFDD